ncbi:MAG: ROK family protein [Anaerolineae bacterium]|nr:ROK family protein [Anaerolineae bacterium]MCO5186779.1 ROK family protein [Anaerolineae bacterium]MCO5196530.1 ROK family protein [Anaerolineae bacterium]
MHVLGIDIGGTGIKGALVDTETGDMVTERYKLATPKSRLPGDVLPVVADVINYFEYQGPVGIGFPAVVVNGVPKTHFTSHRIMEWVGFPVAARLSDATGCQVTLLNDADAAGIAEMQFGHGKGENDTVILLTLGTGLGSALFVNNMLLPNTEFGNLWLKGWDMVAERYAAERARFEMKLSWQAWAKNLDKFLNHIDHIFSPQLIILGGGGAKKTHKYMPYLTVPCRLAHAELGNQAGIVGAAMAAVLG